MKEKLKKDWKDLRIPRKHGLKIGVVKFPAAAAAAHQTGNTTLPTFTHDPLAPTVEEVLNSLDFLLKLRLFHPKEATKANDSMMREIALMGDAKRRVRVNIGKGLPSTSMFQKM